MEINYSSYSGENKETFKSKVIEFIETSVVFLSIGLIIWLFLARPHKVFGNSMVPNFHSGDYVITDLISYRFKDPKIGQIIVFKNPRDESQIFIKRIVGTPSDIVKIEDGRVYVNDKLLNEYYLPAGLITTPNAFIREGVEIIVPEDKFLVFGDNRLASSDSREWGFITRDEIIGKASLRYWPITSFGFIESAKY